MGKLIRNCSALIQQVGLLAVLKIVMLLLLAIAGYQSYVLYQISAANLLIEKGVPADYNENSKPELLFAKAWQLGQQGHVQEALQAYNSIGNKAVPKLQEQARYNSATLLLNKAAKQWNELGVLAYAEVDTLVSLAEDGFRKVLRDNPDNWDARYNLEYTLRIRPPRKEVGKSDWEGRKSSVYAILPGIPNEGP